MTTDVLLIFLSDPEAQSPISLALGEEKAREIAEKLEVLTHDAVEDLDCRKIIFYAGDNLPDAIWNSGDFIPEQQSGLHLNNKIEQAFFHYIIQDKDDVNKVIYLSADCPGISEYLIEKAFDSLNKYDVCIGPEKKGGYYLIGMKEPLPFLFADALWSGKQLLDDTLEEIIEQGKTFFLLDELQSVGDIYDLRLMKE